MIRARQIKAESRGNFNFGDDIVGSIVFENESYITVQGKNYRTCINKYDILMGIVEVTRW